MRLFSQERPGPVTCPQLGTGWGMIRRNNDKRNHSKNRVGVYDALCESVAMNDYERIASVIRYLDQHNVEQPDLKTLARHLDLSESRFHRLFVSWAGVTPKDFLQSLTLCHAKTLLHTGESVLQAALRTGLSGPGRLHDLFVSFEAATPGEWKSGGADLMISYGVAETPFGACLIAQTGRGICRIAFCDGRPDSTVSELRLDWPKAELKRDDAKATRTAAHIFQHARSAPGLKLFVKGTAFQLKVWRALLRIPEGSLSSYRRIAESIGRPGAARAVGTAVGSNPIAYLIPCHRVIRETGVLGGYRWGLIRKQAMIARETVASNVAT